MTNVVRLAKAAARQISCRNMGHPLVRRGLPYRHYMQPDAGLRESGRHRCEPSAMCDTPERRSSDGQRRGVLKGRRVAALLRRRGLTYGTIEACVTNSMSPSSFRSVTTRTVRL